MIAETSFNSKLLLFGEYGLMVGAMALSVPFSKFSGMLGFDEAGSNKESTAEIQKFYTHLKGSKQLNPQFDLSRLEKDLESGLFFDSNIPHQYGLGSSGALVAALFNEYAIEQVLKNELLPEKLQIIFAQLESHFHGRSSGLDPLTSFLNRPLLVEPEKGIRPVAFSLTNQDFRCALIDTHSTGPTGPLVQHFIEQMKDLDFKKAVDEQFIPANNACITAILKGEKQNFFTALELLINFQINYFNRMIPPGFKQIISDGLSDGICIKLLGSGGGGFLIAFAQSNEKLKYWASKNKIDSLGVN
jgi:mevalonate kinase